VETDLVLADNVDHDALAQLNARGKIILTSAFPRSIKLHMARNGILGAVSDFMEPRNRDLINVNQWLNGWSDLPGGWLMTAADDRNQFGFSISQKKGNYLRKLLRSGKKVRVRARIDSRYFTDGSLTYITGCIRGSNESAGDVIALAHIFEWGTNDNAGGTAVILEAVGALNDLIRAGKIPRPKRSIRVRFGHEIYGSMAFTANNINRIRSQTLATLCCDGTDRYGHPVTVLLNPDGCPSFTDAVLPELLRLYFTRIAP